MLRFQDLWISDPDYSVANFNTLSRTCYVFRKESIRGKAGETKHCKVGNCKLDDYELMECIDEGLNLFGPNIRYTVYWRMVILQDMPREGICQIPTLLSKAFVIYSVPVQSR